MNTPMTTNTQNFLNASADLLEELTDRVLANDPETYRGLVAMLSKGGMLGIPDGHFKFPHLWPVKLLQAGRTNYQSLVVSRAMRAAASFSR